MFIGTARNDRIKILYKIFVKNGCNLEYVFHLYFQHIFVYFLRVLMNPYLLTMPTSFCQLRKVPYETYLHKLEQVSYVLDIESSKQSGLTVRSIEALCNGKTLLTTNTFAFRSPLNTGENIYLVKRNGEDPLRGIAMDRKSNIKIDPELVKKYHIDFWLEQFFE